MSNWLVNTLALISLIGISSHWYYLSVLDVSKNDIEKGSIVIHKDNVKISVNTNRLKTTQKKKIQTIEKIKTKKNIAVELLDSRLLYVGYIVGDKGEYIALTKKNNKAITLKEAHKYGSGIVMSIDKTSIHISGYKPIYIKGYKKKKRDIKPIEKKIIKGANKETNVTENSSKDKEYIGRELTTVINESADVNVIKKQSQIQGMDSGVNKKTEPRILRSLIRDIKDQPTSIYKYVNLYKSQKGISVTPKANYKHIFFGIGLRMGDVITEINGHSVKSPGILLQAMNAANKTKITLLLENNGKSRTVIVNLMKVFEI